MASAPRRRHAVRAAPPAFTPAVSHDPPGLGPRPWLGGSWLRGKDWYVGEVTGEALRRWRLLLVPFVAVAVLVGCSSAGPDPTAATPDSAPSDTLANGAPSLFPAPVARTSGAAADVVLDWMDLQTSLVQRETLGPPIATRIIGYTSLALAQGVRLATPGVAPLAVDGLALPEVPSETLNPAVAGAAATATVTRALIPGLEAQRSVDLLEAQQVAAAGAIDGDDGGDLEASVSLGNAVGAALLELAATDGFDGLPQRLEEPLPTGPGAWVPTPPAFEFPLEPYWGTLRPLVATDADCPIPAPVPYDETPGSAFDQEAMAVADAVANLTDEQRATVLYWRDRPGTSYTPVGHWVRIATNVIEAGSAGGEGTALSLVDAATTYAALGVAAYDAFIANWAQKYATNVLRPITYLQARLDPEWKATIVTPPFPAYPSGHSTGSATAATVLAALLGDQSFTDTAGEFADRPPRTYPSFGAAADEASRSRLYGGIHFPMDLEAGKLQGRCIGSVVLSKLGLPESGSR